MRSKVSFGWVAKICAFNGITVAWGRFLNSLNITTCNRPQRFPTNVNIFTMVHHGVWLVFKAMMIIGFIISSSFELPWMIMIWCYQRPDTHGQVLNKLHYIKSLTDPSNTKWFAVIAFAMPHSVNEILKNAFLNYFKIWFLLKKMCSADGK